MDKIEVQRKLKQAREYLSALEYNAKYDPDFPCKEDKEMMEKAKWLLVDVLSFPAPIVRSIKCHCITNLSQSRCKHYRAYQCCKEEDLLTKSNQ